MYSISAKPGVLAEPSNLYRSKPAQLSGPCATMQFQSFDHRPRILLATSPSMAFLATWTQSRFWCLLPFIMPSDAKLPPYGRKVLFHCFERRVVVLTLVSVLKPLDVAKEPHHVLGHYLKRRALVIKFFLFIIIF